MHPPVPLLSTNTRKHRRGTPKETSPAEDGETEPPGEDTPTTPGGVTERGSAGRTKVIRIVGGKKVEKKVKPTDLVQPEDTLMVPERFF